MLLVVGVMAIGKDDGSVEQQPADTPPITLPDTDSTAPNPTTAPSATETSTNPPDSTTAPSTTETSTNPPAGTGAFEVVEGTKLSSGSGIFRYSADASLVATGIEDSIFIHDAKTLTLLRELPCPTSLATLPDSAGTAPSEDTIWNVAAAAAWDSVALSVLKSPGDWLCPVAVNTDGSRAVTVPDMREYPRLLLWNTADGSLLALIPGDFAGFSARESTLVTTDNATSFSLWDASTGAMLTTVTDGATNIVLSPDGSRMLRWTLPAGTDRAEATVYDLQTVTSVATLATEQGTLANTDAVFDDTGRRIATWDEAGVTIWDASTGTKLHHMSIEPAEHANSITFSPGGAMLAVTHGGDITIFDTSSGVQLANLELDPGMLGWGGAVFSPDGASLTAGVADVPPHAYVGQVWRYRSS